MPDGPGRRVPYLTGREATGIRRQIRITVRASGAGTLGPPPAGPATICRERHMISGKTTLIAHLGYPTTAFKAPMIYNPYFEQNGIDAVVMPMGVKAEDYAG